MSRELGPIEWRAWSTLEPEIRSALEGRVERELADRSFSGAMVYFVVAVVLAFSTPYYTEHPVILLLAGSVALLTGSMRLLAAQNLLSDKPRRIASPVFRFATYASFTAWGLFCAWTVHLYGGEWTAMFLLLCTASPSFSNASIL